VSCHSPDPKTKIGSEIPAWGNSELGAGCCT
jgi:predicted CxxxxCH...CXXCH cytochrome family protein